MPDRQGGRTIGDADPLSTSSAQAHPADIWGRVIGGNIGAAQACGASEARIARHLEGVAWQVAQVTGDAQARSRYDAAYDQARTQAADAPRSPDQCRQVLAALGN